MAVIDNAKNTPSNFVRVDGRGVLRITNVNDYRLHRHSANNSNAPVNAVVISTLPRVVMIVWLRESSARRIVASRRTAADERQRSKLDDKRAFVTQETSGLMHRERHIIGRWTVNICLKSSLPSLTWLTLPPNAMVTTKIGLQFNRRSTFIRLQFDRATTIRRPTLRA